MNRIKNSLYLLFYSPFYAIKMFFIGAIRLYQILLSPLLPSLCRFHPSCSQYFIQALRKKGLFKGFAMGVWRIIRCNPLCEGGYDPVDKEEKIDINKF